MVFEDAVQIFRDKLDGNSELKPRTKAYYGDIIKLHYQVVAKHRDLRYQEAGRS